MYNEQRKQRYIEKKNEEVILSPGFVKKVFTKSAPVEEEADKDICEFTIKEIMDFYKLINTKSLDVLTNINSMLGGYTRWCIEENLVLSGINNFYEVTNDLLNQCVNKLALQESVISENDFNTIVLRLRNSREKYTVQMLYETGRSEGYKNIFETKISDFNLSDHTLHTVDDKIVRVSDTLLEVAKAADEDMVFYSYGDQNIKRGVERKLGASEYIYKELDNVNNPQRRVTRLSRTMRRALEEIGINKWVKLNSFVESGLINHIKKIAKENNISSSDVLKNSTFLEEVEYQHNVTIKYSSFMRKYKDFL